MQEKKSIMRNNELEARSVMNSGKGEKKIIYDSTKLEEFISNWMTQIGWEVDDFARFVELTGLKTPIKLSEFDKKNMSFKCTTALNSEIVLTKTNDDELKICESREKETKQYKLSNNFSGDNEYYVFLREREIERERKLLSAFYSPYFCSRQIMIDETHKFELCIVGPNGGCYEKLNATVLRNLYDIDEYLLSLDNSLIVTQVYDRIMELLEFSEEDILNSSTISISYNEMVGKEEIVRSKILKQRGKMQEYAVLEDGETFYVIKGGDWKYLSDKGIRINYIKESDQYDFFMTGSEFSIGKANIAKIIKCIKARISELWKYIE